MNCAALRHCERLCVFSPQGAGGAGGGGEGGHADPGGGACGRDDDDQSLPANRERDYRGGRHSSRAKCRPMVQGTTKSILSYVS